MTASGRVVAGRRVAWGTGDQIVVSLSNVLVVILVARAVDPTSFGAFTVAMEGYFLALCISRGMASDPLTTTHAADSDADLALASGTGAGVALMGSLGLGVILAVIAVTLGGIAGSHLLALAILLPGLVIQDYARFALIVRRDVRGAFLNDLLYVVVEVPLLVVVTVAGQGSVALLVAWGAAAYIAAIVGLRQAGIALARPVGVREWLHRHRAVWPFYLLDNLLLRVSSLVLFAVLAIAAGFAEVAGLRAAITVFAPMAIIGRGIVSVVTPELARRRSQPDRVRRYALLLSAALTPLPLLWGVVFSVLPDGVGEALLGESWEGARSLLIYAAFFNATSMFATSLAAGLRAMNAAREGLSVRIGATVVTTGVATVAAALSGAHGAAVLLAASTPLQCAAWWVVLARATRRRSGGLRPSLARGARGTRRWFA